MKNYKYCPVCKQEIPREETLYCPCECGKIMHFDDANYCGECGKKLEKADGDDLFR